MNQAPSAALTIDGLTRTYRSRAGTVHALRGVTHVFRRGTFTAVMGPSGSGKSTLLQLAAGLDRPTRGRVTIGETRLDKLNETALTRFRRTSMAFVFQTYNLLDALTAFDNVALPARLAGRHVDPAAVQAALAAVGLAEHARRRPAELSGGQQQRVAIARALHGRPDVLFADEPTGALDRGTGRGVLQLLRSVTDGGQSVVMVTHDPLAASYADDVLFLADGGLYAAIAIVNATALGAFQRRRQRDLVQLLGATPDQVRRAAIWQAILVCGTGLLLGGATTVLLGWLVRRAITADLADSAVPITIPWLPLLAIGVTCLLLTAAAGIRTRKAPNLAEDAA
jgi:putative ABC transport system ATP-binding protein